MSPEGSSKELYGHSYGEVQIQLGLVQQLSSVIWLVVKLNDVEEWNILLAWLMYLSKDVFTTLLWIYWTLPPEHQLLSSSDEISRFSKSSISKVLPSLSDASSILKFDSFNFCFLLLVKSFSLKL